MAHTPGPWNAEFSERGGYDCMTDAWHISATAGGGWPAPIATVDLSHYGQTVRNRVALPEMSRAKAEADARLIAAAPDLLEALQELLHRFVGLVNSGDAGDWDPEDEEGVIAARAAIAKAEGRE